MCRDRLAATIGRCGGVKSTASVVVMCSDDLEGGQRLNRLSVQPVAKTAAPVEDVPMSCR